MTPGFVLRNYYGGTKKPGIRSELAIRITKVLTPVLSLYLYEPIILASLY